MSLNEKVNEKVLPMIMKFIGLKGVVALKDGILFILPLTLVGSVFLLLAQIPYEPFNQWMASTFGADWTEPLFQAFGVTFNIIALITTLGIAYTYAKNEGHEPLSAGVIAIVTFLLTNNSYIITESGEKVAGIIQRDAWCGGKGMITAIIIGLIVGAVYSWFLKKGIKIKMPAGVPQGVANSFSALIPAAVIITGTTIIYSFFRYALGTTLIEAIYKIIQTPLQGMTDSLGGITIYAFIVSFLWWFGVHGGAIGTGIMTGIFTSNMLENQAIIDSGKELTIANGGHIITTQFIEQFIGITGSGITIGLVICMIVLGKSQQCKQLGKLAIGPGMFNINEPVIFGVPIVMNPFMAIPFVAAPVISGILSYTAMKIGLIPLFTGVNVPWTCPGIISGFILGGWRTALWQVFLMVLSIVIYFPFFKRLDNVNYAEEKEAQEV